MRGILSVAPEGNVMLPRLYGGILLKQLSTGNSELNISS